MMTTAAPLANVVPTEPLAASRFRLGVGEHRRESTLINRPDGDRFLGPSLCRGRGIIHQGRWLGDASPVLADSVAFAVRVLRAACF
jgi:hypothetical protein